jgi:methionyl aminopeptidase
MTITIKSHEEIEKMRAAGKNASMVLDMITEHVRPNITTDQLNQLCHDYMVNELKVIPAPLNYKGFPKSICTSLNHQVCHGIPSIRKLKDGDILNVDVTVIKDGFHGDTSRMFTIGKPSVLAQRLIRVTQECLNLGIAQVKPGATLGDIGFTIQTHAEKNGFSVVRDFCGHGIGRNFHEEPAVLHFGKPGTGKKLEPGMTFTIEPMINAGHHAIKILPDGWTAVTKDHSLSAQWEHTLLVTDSGVEILTLTNHVASC